MTFVDNGRLRFRRIPLEWPIDFEGKTYAALRIGRLTAGEVATFFEKLRGLPEGASLPWPVFTAEDGSALPDGLLDALDADDRDMLDEAIRDFLPRRSRGAGNGGSSPAPGANTE